MTDKEREAWQKEQALRAAERTVDMEGLPQGHPIQLLRRENGALFSLIEEIENAENTAQFLLQLTEIRRHYAKTEELLMPLLYRYGVTGPSKAIWDADDEAKQMLSALLRRSGAGEELPREEVTALFARLRDVATREEKVLFPLALRYFTEDEWNRVYRDLPEIGCAFIDEKDAPRWDEGEAFCRMEDEKDKKRIRWEKDEDNEGDYILTVSKAVTHCCAACGPQYQVGVDIEISACLNSHLTDVSVGNSGENLLFSGNTLNINRYDSDIGKDNQIADSFVTADYLLILKKRSKFLGQLRSCYGYAFNSVL